eukprot:3079867-Rhodomonas_salina.1
MDLNARQSRAQHIPAPLLISSNGRISPEKKERRRNSSSKKSEQLGGGAGRGSTAGVKPAIRNSTIPRNCIEIGQNIHVHRTVKIIKRRGSGRCDFWH